MKTYSITKAELEERSFGSSFDPLLNGVAQGLAKLFPPVQNARQTEPANDAGRLHEVEDDTSDE